LATERKSRRLLCLTSNKSLIRAHPRLQPKPCLLLKCLLVVVRVLDHQIDALVRIENFFLLWDLTVVVHFHASIDLDTRLARRWGVSLLLLVVLESLVEPPLFGGHASFWSSVRGLASTEVGVGQIHLAGVRRVSRALVAQVLHLHLPPWRRSLVEPALIWLHLIVVWPSVILEILRLALSLIHIHVVRRRSLVHSVVVLRRRASGVLLLLRRIPLAHSVILRRLVRVLALVVWWLSLVHSVVLRRSLVWPWPLVRPSVHR